MHSVTVISFQALTTEEIDPVLVAKKDILAVQPFGYNAGDCPGDIDTLMSRHGFYHASQNNLIN
ncbi:MAG: hypothetical protein C4563_07595 [Desulfobulbus sp.]|nr:MAG: hypothetical protein C4563_07595 [Desulfobulbus sp.]